MTLRRWTRQGQGAAASSSALTSFTQMQTRVLAHKSPCTQESLSTRVLVHAGPSQRSRWKKVQHSKRHTSSHLLNFQHPKATLHVLPPWTTTFSESSMQTGCPQRKTKVCDLEFCFNHTFLYMLDGPAEQFSALKTH